MSNKSVTIKIGGDTKDFIKGLKNADKQINTTQKTADSLSKSLKIEFSSTKFVQAQKQYTLALEQTEAKAEILRKKLRELEASGQVDTANYAAFELELAKTETRVTDLKQKLKDLNKTSVDNLVSGFKSVGQAAENAGKKFTGISAVAGGAVAGITAISKKSAALGAEIDDLSLRFGVSAETIQRWQYLAVQSGVESDTFTKALVKMRAAMTDLSTGTANNASNALQSLGITPNQFKTQEEMFNGIVTALSRVKDATLQTAYANEIFGDKIATQMLPYINTGAETLKKFEDEFAAMPSLSNQQVAALAELDDTYYRLSETMQYATAQLGVAFAPLMERFVGFIEATAVPAIEGLAEWFDGLSPVMQNVLFGGLSILAMIAPALILIGKLAGGISSLITLFKALNLAQIKTIGGFASIAGVAMLALDIIGNWENLSAVEVLLKGLGIAALAAAAAMTVFHASWSVGIAVATIGAAIAGGLALIKMATEDIYPEENTSASTSASSYGASFNPDDYDIPNYSSDAGNSYVDNTNNSTFNVTVNVTEPGASAEEIGEAVSRAIATAVQSRR